MFNKFLEELNQKSIKIAYKSGKITYEGPENHITPELIEKLKKYKESLIRFYWPQECTNLMPINPLGSRIPLVLVYFEVMNYPLCEFLGKDQPFYGFLHYGSKGEEIKFKNVESFAANYITQLQKVLPNGPYLLGGFSFGGILAFEMAVQLQKAGYEVPFLALLDSKTTVTKVPFVWHKNIKKLIISNILGPIRRKLVYITRISVCRLFFIMNKPVPVSLRNFYIDNKYEQLTARYKPTVFNGEALLFKPYDADPELKYNGWEPFVKKVNLVHFKGVHMSIAREKEYAELIGREFLNLLSKVYDPSQQTSKSRDEGILIQ